MYSLYVYDEDLLRQGVVEDIDSLQWLSLYAGAGEVKLVGAATDKNLDLLRRGRRLWCTEQPADARQDLMYYGEDYFLGDVLPLKLTRYGLRLAARLTGVRTIYEASGRNVVLQLGDISILQEV